MGFGEFHYEFRVEATLIIRLNYVLFEIKICAAI